MVTTKQKIIAGVGGTALLASLLFAGRGCGCAKHEEPEPTPAVTSTASTPSSGALPSSTPTPTPSPTPTPTVTVTVTPTPPEHPSGIYEYKVLDSKTGRKVSGKPSYFLFKIQLKPEGAVDSEYTTYVATTRYENGKALDVAGKAYVRDLFFEYTRPDGTHTLDRYFTTLVEGEKTEDELKEDAINTPDYETFGPRASPSVTPSATPKASPSPGKTSYNSLDRMLSYNSLNKTRNSKFI